MKYFTGWKEWLGAQPHVTVKRLYKEPILRRWAKPTIWLSNTDPRHDMEPADVAWMNKNCIFVEVYDPIFRANT